MRHLEPIRKLSAFQLLAELLPERVGSLLSLHAFREDLAVSHRALTHWMDVLERFYHVFRVRPFGGPRGRSLTKMPKAYLWDWSLVPERAARFENHSLTSASGWESRGPTRSSWRGRAISSRTESGCFRRAGFWPHWCSQSAGTLP